MAYTGASPGTVLPEGTKEAATATGSGTLFTTVGETPLVLHSPELECKECTISNQGGTAVGTGKLVFKKVTVEEPEACKVKGGQIETVLLEIKADYMIGSTNYILFAPEEGTKFATVTLEGCPLSGSYNITGTDFVQSTNATGVFAKVQSVTSSGTINSTAGGELKFGSKKAELKGSASFQLTSGKEFATK